MSHANPCAHSQPVRRRQLARRLSAITGVLLVPAITADAAPLDPNGYASQGNLSVSSGVVTFDTDTLQITGGGAGVFNTTGVLQAQGVGQPSIAVFDFSNVNIGAGATIQVVGSNPIAILSQGNLLIVPAINLSGAAGAAGANAPATPAANNGQDGTSAGSSGGNGGPAPVAANPGGKGGNGGFDNGTGQAGSPGSGGASGGPGGPSSGSTLVESNPGQPGQPGANGVGGLPGVGASSPAVAGPTFFLPSSADGTAGAPGTPGQGGGGGGGGGGGSSNPFANADRAGGGGSGGNGGAGGASGAAGLGGAAIEIGAVGTATVVNGISSNGGAGGNGGDRALGSAGGLGGNGPDSGGNGGMGGDGGDGGYGGPGGGGAGGAVFLHSSATSVSSVSALGGIGGTNNAAAIASPGDDGLLKLSGTTLFNVAGYTPGSYDSLSVNANFDIDGTVHFAFSADALAMQLETLATLDTFFLNNPALAEFSDVTFTGQSPTTPYDITLNNDRTFEVTAVPEPVSSGMLALLAATSTLSRRRRR